MEEALLKIREVSKHFGGVYAVNEVNLDIREGGIWGLVGPNGSGKTTLFNTILGLYKPDSGNIYFNGKCINALAPHDVYRQGVVNAFQIPRLFDRMSVLDNMLVAARGHQGDKCLYSLFWRKSWQKQEEGLIDEALDILKLVDLEKWAFSLAGELSGGQRKLLEVGRGLMAKPRLLLLDEPAAGINPALGKSIFQRLKDFSRNGITFFIVEHRLELLFEFANWVYVMDRGRIVAQGEPHEVVDNPAFYEAYLGKE
ncbi:MAG: ABC transporter ATP-binding protein [Dehalococcoidales bacterium]|jgi:branched-chain amino acid transport system ATP-binding protein|nr:ABC transporter ATP-binding protein [Dehalococcoidales bacterium]